MKPGTRLGQKQRWIHALIPLWMASVQWCYAQTTINFSGNVWVAGDCSTVPWAYGASVAGASFTSPYAALCCYYGSRDTNLLAYMEPDVSYTFNTWAIGDYGFCDVLFNVNGLGYSGSPCLDLFVDGVFDGSSPAWRRYGTGAAGFSGSIELRHNTNSTPKLSWTVKDSSGEHVPEIGERSHMLLTADGMSQATGTVINTAETPTFTFSGPPGCTFTTNGNTVTVQAGTNFGTATISLHVTNADLCNVTNYFFDLTECSSCAAGDSSCPKQTKVSSVDVRVDLGPSLVKAGNTFLQVKSDNPSLALGTPQLIRCDFVRPELVKITDANGWIRQVKSADRFVDVLTNSATSYSLLIYGVTNALYNTNGVYQLTGSPYQTLTVQLVGGDTNHVQVTDSLDSSTADYVWQTNSWALTTGGGLRTETFTSTQVGAIGTKVRTVKNALGGVESMTTETWQTFSFGDRLTQQVFGSAGNARTNTYSYNSNGLLDTVTRWDGSWDIYRYDSKGRQTNHFTAFTNSAPTTTSSQCRLIANTYTNSVVSGSGDNAALEPFTPRQVVESVLGVEIARSYTVVQSGMRIDIQCVNPGATWNNATNLFTTNYLRADGVYFGKPARIVRPDLTIQVFDYANRPDSSGLLRRTVWTGAQSGFTSVTNGTREDTWTDGYGRLVEKLQTDIASSIVTSSNYYSYDERNRLTNTTFLDGTSIIQIYDCCDLTSTTERDGTISTYTHDALHRLLTTTRAGVTTSNVYDSVGNVLAVVRYGSDGSAITTSQATFDDGGRQTSATDALSNLTKFTNYLDSTSQLIRVTTNQDQTTRIETYARGGSLMKVSGTAVHGVRYVYGAQSDGGFQRRSTKEIKLDSNGNDTTEWTITLMDGVGRTYKVTYSDNAISQSFFNTQGHLVKQTDPDLVSTLFQYNNKGELEYTALDLNTNGAIDFTGADRITRTASDVITNTALNANVRRTLTYAWFTNSSSVSNLISSSETSVDGFHTWQTSYRDSSTAVTNRTDIFYAGAGSIYQTNIAPDGSYSISQSQSGRLLWVTSNDSLNNQLFSVTYTYDPHGRQSQVTDARNGATTYGYNNADMVTGVTTPASGNGQNPQTTFNYYNSRLQISSVTAPDGATTTYEYHPTGELKRTYGARTYPVGYSYDYAGRVKTMTNWTSFAGNAGVRVTTWNYNANRGWLDNKRYDNNAGPDYTYTPGGRLKSRVWARTGTGSLRIATTNTYGFNDSITTNQFPDLVTVTYANDPQSTPAITNTYDRRGRLLTVTRAGMTKSFAYNLTGQMLYETNSGGTLNSWWVTNSYDTLMRRTNFQANLGATINANFGYGYDAASRLQSVTDGTNNAVYSYIASSPLVGQIALQSNATTRLTVTKTYDYLNRLLTISSVPSAASALSFGYSMNDANQRIQATLADGSCWMYEYDSLGQVKSGKRYWPDWTPVAGQQFEYAHDDIGNRTSTKAGGDENGANLRSATYSANNLNQYTNRTVPGAVDIIGAANATATVTVNDQSTYRHSEYYRKELSINNASALQWQAVTNKAVEGTTTNAVAGNVFQPKTPEVFIYDTDGNLLSDGRWTNSWDAENRLISMQGLSALPTAARQKLDFEYDWMGRRIRKTVSNWNGSSFVAQSTNKFLYDGWNLVIEANPADAAQRRYLWGLDMSGSLQGGGGVGGLLAIQDVSGTNGVSFVGFDGNGNVAALVRANDGTVSANYEYGPFGEVLRSSGSMAKVNPIRFSMKYQDDESDLLYYGYRYNNPSTGRWLDRDPIEEGGGLNIYCFVQNNSPNDFDLLGREDHSDFHPIATLAITKLQAEMGDSQAAQAIGFPAVLTKIKGVIPNIQRVTINPKYLSRTSSAEYVPFWNWMRLRGTTPDGLDVLHESVHAYNKLVSGLSSSDRTDEGMAYSVEQTLTAWRNLKKLEDLINNGCEQNREKIIGRWKIFWSSYGSPGMFTGGSLNDSAKTSFKFNAADFSNINKHFGLNFSCKAIANALTGVASKCGCCMFFTCDAEPSSPYSVPAQVQIDPAFQ